MRHISLFYKCGFILSLNIRQSMGLFKNWMPILVSKTNQHLGAMVNMAKLPPTKRRWPFLLLSRAVLP